MGIHGVVLGATGYTGAELLRLLEAHPVFEVVARSSRGGRSAQEQHLAALHLPEPVSPEEALSLEADVVFCCLPADAAEKVTTNACLIDLSDAHRGRPGWVYGLTEYCRTELPSQRVANPGCYPTASLLALLPFARAGLVEEPVVIDAMSGYSGAGRSHADHLLLADGYGTATAYGGTDHRHVAEIERALRNWGGLDLPISFTPHLVPMARGLLVTARARLSESLDDATAVEVLRSAYSTEPFVSVVEGWPATKAVLGSNSAVLSARVDGRTGWLIVSCAIDNLTKGAAGQALQNANAIFGLEESLGLPLAGVWP